MLTKTVLGQKHLHILLVFEVKHMCGYQQHIFAVSTLQIDCACTWLEQLAREEVRDLTHFTGSLNQMQPYYIAHMHLI